MTWKQRVPISQNEIDNSAKNNNHGTSVRPRCITLHTTNHQNAVFLASFSIYGSLKVHGALLVIVSTKLKILSIPSKETIFPPLCSRCSLWLQYQVAAMPRQDHTTNNSVLSAAALIEYGVPTNILAAASANP